MEKIDSYLLDTVDSTNTYAKEKLLAKDYLVVISEQQTAGRGRQAGFRVQNGATKLK